jgi:hypothetical protein
MHVLVPHYAKFFETNKVTETAQPGLFLPVELFRIQNKDTRLAFSRSSTVPITKSRIIYADDQAFMKNSLHFILSTHTKIFTAI